MTRVPSMKVLHVIDTLGMGGAETWLMELLRLWARRGSGQMDFLATSGNPGIFDEEARALGARIYYLKFGRANLGRFVADFRKLLRSGAYQAIHDHQDYASGWHFLAGTGTLPPVRVTHVHNPWLHMEANYAVSPSRRMAAALGKQFVRRISTHICGTSAQALRQYGFDPDGIASPAIAVVHCGIAIEKFNAPRETDRSAVLREFGWSPDAKIALFAGRLDRALEIDHPQNHKNSWFAVNVARVAHNRDPSLRLLMAGAGDAVRKELERRIGNWGLGERIRLIGVRRDMPRLMRAADALLFPSRQEGLGMVAVEAQAACLPVLASTAVPRECVVIPDLVDALPLSESAETWADALLRAMAKSRPSLERCRSLLEASGFSIENSARRLEAIYWPGRQ